MFISSPGSVEAWSWPDPDPLSWPDDSLLQWRDAPWSWPDPAEWQWPDPGPAPGWPDAPWGWPEDVALGWPEDVLDSALFIRCITAPCYRPVLQVGRRLAGCPLTFDA